MRCAECDRLRADIADLREQLAAWEAYDARDDAEGLDLTRASRWARFLGVKKPDHHYVRLALLLVDNPGRVFTIERLHDAIAGRDAETLAKMADVQLCRLRHRLRELARKGMAPSCFDRPDGGIVTHWGAGRSMGPAEAEALRAAAGDHP